jgi:hypothetical protein
VTFLVDKQSKYCVIGFAQVSSNPFKYTFPITPSSTRVAAVLPTTLQKIIRADITKEMK